MKNATGLSGAEGMGLALVADLMPRHSSVPMVRDQRLVASPRPTASPTPARDHESGPDWRRVASALLRFKWLVLAATVLGLGAAFAMTRMLKPVYMAQANVWVDAPNRTRENPTDARGPIRTGALLEADAWVELLKSYVVLDQVVRDLRLYLTLDRPADRSNMVTFRVDQDFRPGMYRLSVSPDGRAYTLATDQGKELERGTVGDSIGKTLGFLWAPAAGTLPPGRAIDFSLKGPRDAARQLGEQLDVRMDLNGNFLALELRGTNPTLIANILNAVAQRYVEVAAQLKREKLTELTKILEDQLRTAQRNLDDAESALSRFRTRTIRLTQSQAPATRVRARPIPHSERRRARKVGPPQGGNRYATC